MNSIQDAFPIPYRHWYAATLFLDAGHPPAQVLDLLGVDFALWTDVRERYRQFHFAGTSWVAGAFRRLGLTDPAQDVALYTHLCGTEPVGGEPFWMQPHLRSVRARIEANPYIGPFCDVDWTAQYICERRFPTIRYVHDGRQVFVDGRPLAGRTGTAIQGVSPQGFRMLGERWFRDEARVYGQGALRHKPYWFVMRGADPKSFAVLNERYARDAAAGYYITNKRLPSKDASCFEVISYTYGRGQKPGVHTQESHYAKDCENVYGFGVNIPGADAGTFEAIGDEGKYFADVSRIYWECTPIENADRATFVCTSEAGQYKAFDKNGPYYAGKSVSVSGEFGRWTRFFEAHPELMDTWWHREKARTETSPAGSLGLATLGGSFFSDGSRILVQSRWQKRGDLVSLDHFDHDSFRHIAEVFGADRHGLRYVLPGLEGYGRDPVKGADPDSFRPLGDGWFRDKGQVYYLDSHSHSPKLVQVRADIDSFEVLGGVYARDAKAIFVEGVRKRDIDASRHVASLGGPYARIGETILRLGKPVKNPGKIDIATARGFPGVRLLIDAQGHMLLGGRYREPIPHLDPATLRFLNWAFAVDDDRVYALTEGAFHVCEGADRATIESCGPQSVNDHAAHFSVSVDGLTRTPLPFGGNL